MLIPIPLPDPKMRKCTGINKAWIILEDMLAGEIKPLVFQLISTKTLSLISIPTEICIIQDSITLIMVMDTVMVGTTGDGISDMVFTTLTAIGAIGDGTQDGHITHTAHTVLETIIQIRTITIPIITAPIEM